GTRQALNAPPPPGKALGELRIADPHVEQRAACDRQRREDRFDVGLVRRGRLVAPVKGFTDLGDPGLFAVATACWGGSISARRVRHRLVFSVPDSRSPPR